MRAVIVMVRLQPPAPPPCRFYLSVILTTDKSYWYVLVIMDHGKLHGTWYACANVCTSKQVCNVGLCVNLPFTSIIYVIKGIYQLIGMVF